jgi:hypothetical protein
MLEPENKKWVLQDKKTHGLLSVSVRKVIIISTVIHREARIIILLQPKFLHIKISTHQRSHSTIQRYHSARKTIVTITHPTFSPQAFRSDIVVSGGWRSLRHRRSMTLFFLFSLPGYSRFLIYLIGTRFKKKSTSLTKY